MRALRRRLSVALGAAILIAGAIAVWWAFPAEPVAELLRHSSTRAHTVRVPLPELGARVERWRIVTAEGDTATGLWRAAAPGASRPWTVVLLGGLRTGDRAALLLPEMPAHLLAMDWPWSDSRQMGAVEIARKLPAIRRAILRTPGILALGVEAVAQYPESDRIALLGASLGVAPTIAALRLTDVPQAVVLLDGGADLERLFDVALRREGCPAVLVPGLAAFAKRLVHPLEPMLHADAARHLHVLVLSSHGDERIPRHSVDRLHASFPNADVRVRSGGHVSPKRPQEIAPLVAEVLNWLDTVPDASIGASSRSVRADHPPRSSSRNRSP